jgi:hypothetical protein
MIEPSNKFSSPSLEVYYELLKRYYMRRLPELLKKDHLEGVDVDEGQGWSEDGHKRIVL